MSVKCWPNPTSQYISVVKAKGALTNSTGVYVSNYIMFGLLPYNLTVEVSNEDTSGNVFPLITDDNFIAGCGCITKTHLPKSNQHTGLLLHAWGSNCNHIAHLP